MAKYQVGRSTYELPDNLDSATLNATLQELAEQEALKPRDSALGYSIDQAQRLGGRALQQIGTAIGSESLAQAGRDYVAEQDEDIFKGGYQSSIQDSGFMEAVQNGRGLSYVGTLMAENGASTLATLGLGAAAGIAGVLSMPITALGLGATALASGIGLGIGETAEVAEQAGLDINDPNTARANLAIGGVVGLLDRVGAGKAVPKDQLVKMTVGEVADELVKQGKTGAAKKFLKETGKGFVAEGTTEAAQSAVMTGGVTAQGGNITSDQVINDLVDSFVVGGATGATVRGGISGVAGAADKIKKSGGIEVRDPQAAADFAKRLEGIADANQYDLNDIDKGSTVGAREVVDLAHSQMSKELSGLFKDLQPLIKVQDADDFKTVSDKIMTKAAYREGRNKAKNAVGKQELDALERLAGDTQEGQAAISLLRQMGEMTRLHNSGYQGGVSLYTDNLSPFGSKVGYDKGAIQFEKIVRPLASIATGVQTGGTSLLLQAGAAGAGRAIDGMTGNRSVVKNYIEQNANREGIGAPTGDSIRLQRQAEEKQKEADAQAAADRSLMLAKSADERGDPFNAKSPLGAIVEATGIESRADMYAALDATLQDSPEFAPEIAAARQSGEQANTEIPNLGLLIGRIKAVTGMDADKARRGSVLEQAQMQQGLRQFQSMYQSGVESNRRLASELRDGINNDTQLSPIDKAVMLSAINDFGRNLGKNPAETIEAKMRDIYEKVTDKTAAMNYLMPYVERVMRQQNAKRQLSDLVRDMEQDNE